MKRVNNFDELFETAERIHKLSTEKLKVHDIDLYFAMKFLTGMYEAWKPELTESAESQLNLLEIRKAVGLSESYFREKATSDR
jgi:hypothetical protein